MSEEIQYDSNRRNFDEFTRIAAGEKFSFYVAGAALDEFYVYVTIFTETKSKIKIITKNLQILNDYGVIVDAKGYIRHAKKGEVWTDTDEKDHKKVFEDEVKPRIENE